MPRCAHEPCQRWRPTWWAPRALSFDGDWFCRPSCLRDEAAHRLKAFDVPGPTAPVSTRFKLGTLLLASRSITTSVLERALERQQSSGRPLGAELLAMGAVDAGTLTHALARQAGVASVSGLTSSHVGLGIAGLSRRVVHALGVLPFELDPHGGLRVAVTAPIPRTALRAVERMTGRDVRTYMIGDAAMASLLEAYGGECPDDEDTAMLASPAEAAAHIAEAARAGRADRWRCVPATSFTWIRLEGGSSADELIVKEMKGEDPWQAAPTRH